MESSNALSDDEVAAYADDPVADEEWTARYEEWTARYEEEIRLNEELEQRLQGRLDGVVDINEW